MSAAHLPEDWQTRFRQLGLHEMYRLARARAPLALAALRFWFLRHGETEGNATRIIQHAEISLNERGFAQARAAAEVLAREPFERIYGSTMTRAWQTAETVARACAIAAIPEDGLRERWFGDLVGTSSVGLDWSMDPPNGERIADFVERICGAAEALHADPTPTLLVAHGGNLYALAFALGAELETAYVANATPLLFEYVESAARWRILPIGNTGSGEPVLPPS